MIGGAALQTFSLFMLSLTQQGQFYQVHRLLCIHCMALTTTVDSSYAKLQVWDSHWINVRFMFIGMTLCRRIRFVDPTPFFLGAASLFGRSPHWLYNA